MHRYVKNNSPRGEFNPFYRPSLPSVEHVFEAMVPAAVVDVVVNDSHPEYGKDGYNVGVIQIRLLTGDKYREQGSLHWAAPLEANISEYPLLNEIVLVFQSLNRFYYTRKLNTATGVTSHPLFGINDEMGRPVAGADKAKGFEASKANAVTDKTQQTNLLGKFFEEPKTTFRLRHDEGDFILEGRSGHSIRFGAAWKSGTNFPSTTVNQSPNLLMRVGPDPTAKQSVKTPFGTVVEDINKDATSLWMVSDQVVGLTPATEKASVHKASVVKFPSRFDGNQLVINTDRFIVNTKKYEIFGFSNLGIHWTANLDFTVDADQDYRSKIKRDTDVNIGRDTLYVIGRDKTFTIGRDEIKTIGRDEKRKVTHDQTMEVGNDQTEKVNHDIRLNVGHDVSRQIGNNVTEKVGHNLTQQFGGFADITAATRFTIKAPKVHLGGQSEVEPVPMGAALAHFLEAFINAHLNSPFHGKTITGTPVSLDPGVRAALSALKAQVARGKTAPFNSKVSFTV